MYSTGIKYSGRYETIETTGTSFPAGDVSRENARDVNSRQEPEQSLIIIMRDMQLTVPQSLQITLRPPTERNVSRRVVERHSVFPYWTAGKSDPRASRIEIIYLSLLTTSLLTRTFVRSFADSRVSPLLQERLLSDRCYTAAESSIPSFPNRRVPVRSCGLGKLVRINRAEVVRTIGERD